MGIKFTNNFVTTISAGINNSVTTIPITSATGFPALGASDYAYCSLQKDSPLTLEIVKVTAISGTNLTVVRAQDGTSAAAFASGDAFELRVTAGGLNDIVSGSGVNLITDNFTGDGSTGFTLSQDPSVVQNTFVYIDGVYQFKNTYSTSGTTLTFSAAPPTGASIEVMSMTATNSVVGTVSDNAVTTAKIADNAVTGAKLNPSLVAGDLIYADGTDTITRLAKGTAEQVLTMNAGATAPEWADIAAGLTLDTTPKTASFTAEAGKQYLCNTNGGAFNMTLPTANVGDTIGIIDYLGTFDTNNLTLVQDVATSNEKIFRVDASGVIDSKNWSTSIKYIDATVGWLPAGD